MDPIRTENQKIENQEAIAVWYNKVWVSDMKGKTFDFQELHRVFRPKILRYLTRLSGVHEAEDLTQEVFLKVSRGLRYFRGQSQLSTWVYRIATNAALDRMRSPSFRQNRTRLAPEKGRSTGEREPETVLAQNGNGEEQGSAESSLIRKEMVECLGQYIEKLPANHRAVVVLSLLEGMKNKEISQILGITLETVKIRLHRGRARLKKDLETHCGWYRDARNHISWDGKIL